MRKANYYIALTILTILSPQSAMSSEVLGSTCASIQGNLTGVAVVEETGAPVPANIEGFVHDSANQTTVPMSGTCDTQNPGDTLFICRATATAVPPAGFTPHRFYFDILAAGPHATVEIDNGRAGC
ncbi:hypothetical protein ACMG4P_07930 [Pseudovibrio denitrificans]|uniref:hypothetical protein n=1 Tax=Pseudovibrio denitrificans TaxID=258256 RepID=UPI0039BEDA30